ncbi:hypothetical protein [Vogesella sp. XCS3]|uniref:hypothetical protein n=1 Tax=Vogesella sp. XCS3 TaxID=2877939 RepID=UPI001D09D1CB|nr:hypothetical protein [Vogesella sp. XCS3]UDM18893.1 hypothetical protein LCH97_18660 [Vogesella sp. XCS3]
MELQLKQRIAAENRARDLVERMFEDFKNRTGIELSFCSGFAGKFEKVVFEAYEPTIVEKWPTKKFTNRFASCVDMERYYRRALAEYVH